MEYPVSDSQRRSAAFVTFYPVLLVAMACLGNWVVFGVKPLQVGLPSNFSLAIMTISAVLMCLNHTWLMTVTELTRVRFHIQTTPEEWSDSSVARDEIPQKGWDELARARNAHRNCTENSVYFVMLGIPLMFCSANDIVSVWLLEFALGRLGHTYGYLYKSDVLRGLFMSISLLAMYGMATYLLMSTLMLLF
ncbi:MAPEG family protein [Vibrio ulleungensis]|jgi:uncharacterized membrane protein YecN with MAPEG domain|uniref:MAPEG family protein n=1 Tax=Vibrio ulleungensis TaxID=2807619 RepID=A0ABS2HF15_9VIBR|nr:MAPEG family protein [Vibrio ulleungensis]MBM7034912.1 MAPEG family protein [Vibrio ulleungensis]